MRPRYKINSKRNQFNRGKKTKSKHFNTRVHLKYNKNFNMRRLNQTMMKLKKQFFYSFFQTPEIFSQQENIKQKCLSTVLFLLSVFSLSFIWIKVSRTADWGVYKCSYTIFDNWWNRLFTVFWNTQYFPIFKI